MRVHFRNVNYKVESRLDMKRLSLDSPRVRRIKPYSLRIESNIALLNPVSVTKCDSGSIVASF